MYDKICLVFLSMGMTLSFVDAKAALQKLGINYRSINAALGFGYLTPSRGQSGELLLTSTRAPR